MPDWWEIIILSLATWRITSLIANESGPFDLFQRLRTWAGEYEERGSRSASTWYGKGLICLWCLSWHCGLWLTILGIIYDLYTGNVKSIVTYLLQPFVLSALAIGYDTLIQRE